MTKKNPKISVLMPNYNCEKYLAEAIESILNQSFTDFEFIIIDDGSTDKSWEIIQEYAKKDNRIISRRNNVNKHIVYSRNRALKISSGEFIAFLDSDDIAYPERLQTQVDLMKLSKNSKIGVCGTNFDVIDKSSNIIGKKCFPETDKDCRKSIWYRNPFGQNTVLVRKKCFDEIGTYDDNFRNAEDLDMWIRIGEKYQLYNIQKNLTKYRVYGNNTILKQQKLMIRSALKVRKKAIGLGYEMPLKGKIHYFGTWCMQFFPPKFVLWLFNKIT